MQWLPHVAQIIQEKEKMPEDCLKQLTIPLHKIGSFHVCDNFRVIVGVLIRPSFSGSWLGKQGNSTPLSTLCLWISVKMDLVNLEALWEMLEANYLLPGKLMCILRALHKGTVPRGQ